MLTFLMLQLLVPAAGVGGLVLFASWLRRERRWREVAERCGLTIESSRLLPFVTVLARSGPVELRLIEATSGVHVTATVQGARPDLAEVFIHRQRLTLPGTREIEIGDEPFDDTFLVKGPEQFVSALLDEPVRRMLRQAADEAASFAVEGNLLRAEVRPDQLVRLLPLFRDLGRCFAELQEVPQRLAEHVRRDPEPGVRLHSLLVLVRDYPGYPCTEEAIRLACEDASPQVRLRAALELGPDGRGVLLALVEGLESDAVSAQAVAGLGRVLPLEFLQSILDGALERHMPATALAATRALGTTGDPAAEAPLLEALVRDNPDLQLAAAAALGRVGSAVAVLPLQELAASAPRELRRAARQAVAEIQARLEGASPGQLSLAAGDAGQLSLASDPAGRLSLPPERAG